MATPLWDNESPGRCDFRVILLSTAGQAGVVPSLLAVQPLANVIGHYTCQNSKAEFHEGQGVHLLSCRGCQEMLTALKL